MTRHRIGIALLIACLALGGGGAAALLLAPRVPPEAIRTAVVRDPELIERAWALPVAARFGRAVDWQSNPSVCGPASLANVFRSLGERAATEGEVLQGANRCWFGFCIIGLTLDQLAGLARMHTSRHVLVLRDLSPDAFKDLMRQANDPGQRMIVNFSRAPIFGSGVGHHAPIGGYLEDEDLVFVLDVNETFGPWLIERERLFEAVDTLDGNDKRGLLLIR
jgi:hypothetical protein